MNNCCHIDIETFSAAPLKKTGLYRYAEDPSTEILCVCYAFGDGPVNLWIPGDNSEFVRNNPITLEARAAIYWDECPEDLQEWVESGKQLRAHNAQFERTLFNSRAGKRIGFPATKISQWVCTAAKVASHGLPRALGDAAKALGTHPKNEDGKSAMYQISKPCAVTKVRPAGRYTPETDPERFVTLYEYCMDDVRAERDIDLIVPDMSPNEQKVWELDQEINDRGIRVDMPNVANVQAIIKDYKTQIETEFRQLTGINPTQTGALADWIRAQGYDISDLQAPTVTEAIKDPKMPPLVKKILMMRSVHASKAVAKYPAMERSVMSDERIRGMFMFYGGHPGRWSSMIVQLQNLFRGAIEDPNAAIAAYAARSLDWIRTLYEIEPMKVFASTVRGMLIPVEGHDLMALDFASIEARIVAWLAGQMDILEVFRGHGKIYEHTAAKIFRIPIEQVTKDQRFIGKIAVLALGYQGGKAAFAKMAKQFGVDIDEDFADKIKEDWRTANSRIKALWYDLEGAARGAIQSPGAVYSTHNKKIMFKVEGRWLYMRLPSGRRIAYYSPQINDESQVTYMGIDTYTRRWMRCSIYGGLILQNACEGIGRDLLVNGMLALEFEGYPVIGMVHDEAIVEILEDFGNLEEASALMCRKVKWADGLPVAVEGWRAKRYKK